ncbi:hypothetical protein IQ06DRAFT_369675 [Phaeosphaeriaceae sp. SRC1lsM3a]|nr:hypothetical protein IQ06DRAFT_369675 [Stagonospora sp. SRC1lsM3a]
MQNNGAGDIDKCPYISRPNQDRRLSSNTRLLTPVTTQSRPRLPRIEALLADGVELTSIPTLQGTDFLLSSSRLRDSPCHTYLSPFAFDLGPNPDIHKPYLAQQPDLIIPTIRDDYEKVLETRSLDVSSVQPSPTQIEIPVVSNTSTSASEFLTPSGLNTPYDSSSATSPDNRSISSESSGQTSGQSCNMCTATFRRACDLKFPVSMSTASTSIGFFAAWKGAQELLASTPISSVISRHTEPQKHDEHFHAPYQAVKECSRAKTICSGIARSHMSLSISAILVRMVKGTDRLVSWQMDCFLTF